MTQRVSPVDVRLRVVALLLEPGLTPARIMALPLDDLEALVTSGYFREARSRGLSFRAIARRFESAAATTGSRPAARGSRWTAAGFATAATRRPW